MNKQVLPETSQNVMSPIPVTLEGHRFGMREASLLLIASGFALLMMDLGNLALVTCGAVVALWLVAAFRGPRPTPLLTLVYGAGLFVTCFWWPREGWWVAAIALTWIGIALMALGGVALIVTRLRRS